MVSPNSIIPDTAQQVSGADEVSARPDAPVPFCKPPTYAFMPKCCQLCMNPKTTYQTHSGLSDHLTVYHRHWYSAHDDVFVPIPVVNLEAKCAQVHKGQMHRHCHRNPADAPLKPLELAPRTVVPWDAAAGRFVCQNRPGVQFESDPIQWGPTCPEPSL